MRSAASIITRARPRRNISRSTRIEASSSRLHQDRLRRDTGPAHRRRERSGLPFGPVARTHLPACLDRVAVRAQRRHLLRPEQRWLVQFRLFPRDRRVRGRRQTKPHGLPRPGHQEVIVTTGAILLGGITLVVVSDLLIALYYRSLADRVESGERVSNSIDPANARKVATMLIVSAPLIWLIVALMSFGVIPSGIDPIKF